jgi:hypothetical protein
VIELSVSWLTCGPGAYPGRKPLLVKLICEKSHNGKVSVSEPDPDGSEMGNKKQYRGHYCKVCGCIRPNERFSGKGHAAHICRTCDKKTKDEQNEQIALIRICRVYRYMNLSRDNRRMLEVYTRDFRERIRLAALDALDAFGKGQSKD